MNYNEAMEFLNSTSKFGMKPGLERIRELMRVLGNPQEGLKYIHIAGTNGKGSTTAMLSSILASAGYKVGMFTSPFIECFEERVQINNENIPKERVGEYFALIKEACDKIKEEFGQVTYFEIVTALGFMYFKDEGIDIGVIEVGLGGRFDATNIIDPILTIITSISYDHTGILGETLGEIAFEKAGIIKKDIPLVLYPQKQEAEKVIVQAAEKNGAQITKVSSEELVLEELDKSMKVKPVQKLRRRDGLIIETPLLGSHQIINTGVVLKAIEVLNSMGYDVKTEDITKGIKTVFWPGRMEMIKYEPRMVIDGAHNIDAIRKLRENLRSYYEYDKLILMVGMLSDKDVEEMSRIIAGEAHEIFVLQPINYRAKDGDELRECIASYNPNVKYIKDYTKAIKEAVEKAGENDLIVATGSFYLIGEIRRIVREI